MLPLRIALVWRRGRGVSPGVPVEVLGLLGSSIGLGQGARLFLHGLSRSGVCTHPVEAGSWVGVSADLPDQSDAAVGPRAAEGVLLTHLNPPELENALEACGGRFLRRRRHIGYWAWELPEAPVSWRSAFAYVDEVWTPSTFSARALSGLGASSTPIYVVPHPVWAWKPAKPDRARFRLPEESCIVLIAFDLKSTAARKNPWGALAAYRQAVAHPCDGVRLVCKVSGVAAAPEVFAALERECADRPDVVLIKEVLPSTAMAALVASADIVFSPHRAEGFGLLLAEGMRLGKAVVATGWSGNMDFMDNDCAALINYELTPAIDPQGMYRDAPWAEPDIHHAARLLGGLIDDPDERRVLGERAARQGGPVFDQAAWGELVAERLAS